ncbi:hypothetical protein EJ04DRAFT_221240 [Polyplosphaeria fusca]|uniref:Uncharacterized protein n=1 Tax=Polyplosphaeria fusca TaxID=682080 RepID=A0A9P4R297_9PLEO|nr:hypothetical protein EJ04DRAFT_221240 [Polyplosphaeria fusca]
MAATSTPHDTSPLTRTSSFKFPRVPPPCTPRNTAKLWDEYEKRALENAKRRNNSAPLPTPHSSRFSGGPVLEVMKSYNPYPSSKTSTSSPATGTARPQFDFDFQRPGTSTTVAICKTCKQAITSASGFCEKCKRTIIIPPPGETTPPLSPLSREFGPFDISEPQDLPKSRSRPRARTATSSSTSPKRRSKSSRPPSHELMELPPRLSSLKTPSSPSVLDMASHFPEPPTSRKGSLTDPYEPFLRHQISRKPVANAPPTPPSTSHSQASFMRTRSNSLANVTTPPLYEVSSLSSRHGSVASSEASNSYAYGWGPTAPPSSASRASYGLQNTTSAWDEWDSDEEKAGLVGYWRGRKWRGSRVSLGKGDESAGAGARDGEEAKKEKKKKRGFVRVISCGCQD